MPTHTHTHTHALHIDILTAKKAPTPLISESRNLFSNVFFFEDLSCGDTETHNGILQIVREVSVPRLVLTD